MAQDAFSGGGIVNLSADLLHKFADQNLGSFIDAVKHHHSTQALAKFSSGTSKGAPSGVSPSGVYSAVLPGNPSGKLASVGDVQAGFQGFASMVHSAVDDLLQKATTMQTDLRYVATIVDETDDLAKLKASEMMADLANLRGGGVTPPAAST